MKKVASVLTWTSKAENVWHVLNGVFAVYKPQGEHILQTLQTLRFHICRDLNNKLEQRPPMKHVWIEGKTNEPMSVTVGPSYADDPLLTGPRYVQNDVRVTWANNMYPDSSGILLVGIGYGTKVARSIKEARPVKFYRVKGILGKATDNFFVTGKLVEKSKYTHVKRYHIDSICASMQSSHQRKMFELCGVPIQSQTAYELAVQGPIRPANSKIPMVYSIKCIDYQPPEFTLEIVCTNDDDMYLKGLVHELGMQVRSTATCTLMQCVRYGIFNLEHALLKKHWNIERIMENLAMCRNLLNENPFMQEPLDPILKEHSEVKQIESNDKLRITDGVK